MIGRGKSRVLIDAGEGKPEYFKLLTDYVDALGVEISAVLLTHWHEDHIGGVPQLLSRASNTASKIPTIYKFKLEEEDDSASSRKMGTPSLTRREKFSDSKNEWAFTSIEDGETIQFDGFKLTGFHTPGHATDHIVYWLQGDGAISAADGSGEQALFSGDNILGEGTTTFENLKDYMESLIKMSSVIKSSDVTDKQTVRIYPAHGNIINDGLAKIEEYYGHRQARENEILKTLDQHHREKGLDESLTVHEIVEIIYKDYPQSLHLAAARGVSLHLNKLKHDSKVQENGAKWKLNSLLDDAKL